MYHPTPANILTKAVSLTNAAFAGIQVIPAKAGHVFCVCSGVISSNDTTGQQSGIQDDAANPLYFGYVGATQAPIVEFSYDALSNRGSPHKTAVGTGVRATSSQPTAGKTVEISVSGFYLKVA